MKKNNGDSIPMAKAWPWTSARMRQCSSRIEGCDPESLLTTTGLQAQTGQVVKHPLGIPTADTS